MEQQDKREAAVPKALRFAPICFWVAWERSPAHICLNLILVESGVENLDKACVTDPITLGIIAITGFEDSCWGISYSPPVGLPDDSGSLFSCRKRRLFNGLLRRGATKKLRNSGGVAHIDDFVRSGLPPCITLGTVTVTSGERLPVEIAGKEGGRRWLNPTMS